jgi:hypothetical protein
MQSQRGQLDCIKRQYQLNWDTIELAPAICPGAFSRWRKQATRQQKMDNKINRPVLKAALGENKRLTLFACLLFILSVLLAGS